MPTLEVGGGGMLDQGTRAVTVMGSVDYAFTGGFVAGMRWRIGYGLPVEIYRKSVVDDPFGDEPYVGRFERTDGTSNLIQLVAIGGYTLTTKHTDVTIGAAFGGVNVAHRRARATTLIGLGPTRQEIHSHETITTSNVSGGFFVRSRLHVTSLFDLTLNIGYDWTDLSRGIVDNPDPGPDYSAVFATHGPWFTVGLATTLEPPTIDTTLGDYRLYIGASIASAHPFTDEPFNEFNPGLIVQYRLPGPSVLGLGTQWFAEAGAYQWSIGDLAWYVGGGLYAPIGAPIDWDWLKLGLLVGTLITHDGGGAYPLPALSPRITIDTKWASITTLFIPVGAESAFGLVVSLPLH